MGGTKEHPLELPIGEGFAVQEDNVALEFNIPASNSKTMFVNNVCSAMEFLESTVASAYGLHFVKESAISFPDAELDHPNALSFGCDPDFNAYTGKANGRPKAKDRNLRSCGGHVHIGMLGTKYNGLDVRTVIKACDLYLGVPSVIMDSGSLRKELYGKAGAYRVKPYGCEYRTLSNFWVFDKKLMNWVYENTERALDAVLSGCSFDDDASMIQSVINNNNLLGAGLLVGRFNLQVV
jgi:hypothetical protein